MKKILFGMPVVFFLMILLVACPYKSKIPIDEANVKLDKNLLGKWIKASDYNNENPSFYDFSKMNNFKYIMVDNEYNSTDSAYKKTNYITHITKINDVAFLNMEKDGEYYLHKIEFKGSNELIIYEVTDNIDENFNTSKELKDFVKKHMHLSFFYNKDEVIYRKK